MDPDQWKRNNLVKHLVMKPQIIKEITSTTCYRVKIVQREFWEKFTLHLCFVNLVVTGTTQSAITTSAY